MATFLAEKNSGVKNKIAAIVNGYIKQNPEDFDIVKKGIEMKRQMTRDEFASLEGSRDMRALFEIPEDLSTRFIMGLTEDETVWFKTKEGARWFARRFPVFALPDSI